MERVVGDGGCYIIMGQAAIRGHVREPLIGRVRCDKPLLER